jgi:hypothetical protein
MSKKALVRLLVRLFGDVAHVEKVRKNPAKTLAAAGLTPAERDLVLSGSDAKLRAYLGADADKVLIKSKATAGIKGKAKTAEIKGKAKTGAIKGKARTAAIKGKTRTAAIKGKTRTAAIKGKARTAAIKGKAQAAPMSAESAPVTTSDETQA